MQIITTNSVDYRYELSIRRPCGNVIVLWINTRYVYSVEPRVHIKNILIDVYNMFLHGLSDDNINELIVVNVVGYRRSSKQLDIRYSLKLHNKCGETLLANTDFYIDIDRQLDCFNIAIDACVNEFNVLRSEFGSDFYAEFMAAIDRV